MLFKKRKPRQRRPEPDDLVKIRGARRTPPSTALQGSRELRPLKPPAILSPALISAGISGATWTGGFVYTGRNRGEFYRYLRDHIPIISAGVWAWTRLCATDLERTCTGPSAQVRRAEELLAALDARVLEMPYGRGSGLARLVDAYFLELFTTGRFAGEAVLTQDGRSVDHFRFLDAYRVSWQHGPSGWTPQVAPDPDEPAADPAPLDPELFFYGTLGTDLANPAGVEPLACIPFVAEIEQLMLEDMARSSHNAGNPRLQVKIARPERAPYESDADYHARANRYFNDIVHEFGALEPDDNIFTWNDVEVTMVGGGGRLWDWRLNREQVLEDVITGLKLFPWVLGRSQKATYQWVQSQFDLLMMMVAAHRRTCADLVDWLCNLELRLAGLSARVKHTFAPVADPFRLDRARAERLELENQRLRATTTAPPP